MKEIFEIFSPSGAERKMKDFLIFNLKDCTDSYFEDKFGNLIFNKNGGGKKICFECGLDEPFVAFSAEEGEMLRFAAPPQISVCDLVGATMVFENGEDFVLKSQKVPSESKISNVYADKADFLKDNKNKDLPKLFDLAVKKPVFAETCDAFYSAAARYKAPIYALCNAIKEIKNSEYDLYFAFTAQKCLGARGLFAMLEANEFESVVSIAALKQDKYISLGDGAAVLAKAGRVPASVRLKKELENAAETSKIKHKTVVTDENLFLNLALTCGKGAFCGALGITFDNKSINRDKILKSDIENITKLIKAYCN